MQENIFELKQGIVGVLGVVNIFLVGLFGDFLPFLLLSAGVMLFDLVSRIYAAAMRDDEEVKSKEIMKGFGKKFGLLMLIILSLFVDYGLKLILELLGVQIVTSIVITGFTIAWIFIREAISIAENLQHAGVPLPTFILKALNSAKDKVDTVGDSIVGGDIH